MCVEKQKIYSHWKKYFVKPMLNFISHFFNKSVDFTKVLPKIGAARESKFLSVISTFLWHYIIARSFRGMHWNCQSQGTTIFHPKGRSPEGWTNWVPRDWQFQCIPRNDCAIVFLHWLLNWQKSAQHQSISRKMWKIDAKILTKIVILTKFPWNWLIGIGFSP